MLNLSGGEAEGLAGTLFLESLALNASAPYERAYRVAQPEYGSFLGTAATRGAEASDGPIRKQGF